MESTILFNPEVAERELDREVSKVNSRFEQTGEITPEVDDSAISDLEPDGIGGVGSTGGGGGSGVGGAAGAGAIASRIPKPVAGVAVGAALPVALGGAVGAGMLSAMHSASARMQTSTSLMGQAWNNVWRPLGDKLDQLFIRDLATELVSETQKFEETLRSGEWASAIGTLSVDLLEGGSGIALSALLPNSAGAVLLENLTRKITGGSWYELPDRVMSKVPAFSWPSIGVPDVPDWSGLNPGIPDWSGLSAQDFINWATSGGNGGGDSVLDETSGREQSAVSDDPQKEEMLGDFNESGDGGGSGVGNEPGTSPGSPGGEPGSGGHVPAVATGGLITRTGVAEVHRGELVSDPDRLVSELANAIDVGGGGGGSVDTSRIEAKLDRLHRDLQDLSRSMSSLSLEVDGETFGRAASETRRNSVSDTNPLI